MLTEIGQKTKERQGEMLTLSLCGNRQQLEDKCEEGNEDSIS